jgi:hypothetical protein
VAGAGASLPDTVGEWSKPSGSSGPGSIYSSGDETVIVSFLSGSSYEGVVTSITADATPAGTGSCGSASSATNLTCYLKTADGVLNISADAGDTPLPDLVAFADTLTTTLGTS